MSYIQFDKEFLVNLEYSLTKELVRSNRAGTYASTSIINCNTRKYHGLLVVPQPQFNNQRCVLLSALDETIIQEHAEFNLAIHRYQGGNYNPKGHKYITDFSSNATSKVTYRIGGIILTREMMFIGKNDQICLKYTLVHANYPTKLRLRPFLAFRSIHALCKANNQVNSSFQPVSNGIKMCLYEGFSPLYMQLSKPSDYIHNPDWYLNFEYIREKARGYDYLEDLFTNGYFEMPVKKGESIYFFAGLEEADPATFKDLFAREEKQRIPRTNFENCLFNSAQQFIINRGNKTGIIAGFPWYGRVMRDSLISLPGLTLVQNDTKLFKTILDDLISEVKDNFFPNKFGSEMKYNSVDASLWFFWTLQQYRKMANGKLIWKQYGQLMKSILYQYKQGTHYNIHMMPNGLLWSGVDGHAVTWMDAVVDGKPVTPRVGLAVEIQALWYNAIRFALELAKKEKDSAFVADWQPIADQLPAAFTGTFWIKDRKYLYDYVNDTYRDPATRPNQIFAVSLPYSMLSDEQMKGVVDRVQSELLTPRGLRTLSPTNGSYIGSYQGNQAERDRAYHQGTVFPWLFGAFADAYLRVYEKSGLPFIKKFYEGFEPVMREHGIGSVSELYDGNPPHLPSGTVSQAWSVAELLRVYWMIEDLGKEPAKVENKKKVKEPKK